eukprot:symbB.v1.2.002429.t1/scaffold129.1/size311234/18
MPSLPNKVDATEGSQLNVTDNRREHSCAATGSGTGDGVSPKNSPQTPRTYSSLLDWNALERMEDDLSQQIATPHVEAPSNETSGYHADVKETVPSADQTYGLNGTKAPHPAAAGPSPGEPVKEVEPEIVTEIVDLLVRHGTQQGEVTLRVPACSTMLQIKEALIRYTGRRAEALQRMQLVEKTGNTFKQFEDSLMLGDRREILVLGLALTAQNSIGVMAYALVDVSISNALSSEAITVRLPEIATIKDVRLALRQRSGPQEFQALLNAGAPLYVYSHPLGEPLKETEPLRGRWQLMHVMATGMSGDIAVMAGILYPVLVLGGLYANYFSTKELDDISTLEKTRRPLSDFWSGICVGVIIGVWAGINYGPSLKYAWETLDWVQIQQICLTGFCASALQLAHFATKNGASIQSPAAFLGTGKQTKHKQAILADVKNTLEYLQEMHHPKLASMNSPLSRRLLCKPVLWGILFGDFGDIWKMGHTG